MSTKKTVKTLKTFIVMAKVNIDTTCEVEAPSLEAAMNEARLLQEEDFVSVLGGYNDGSLQVYGVYEA